MTNLPTVLLVATAAILAVVAAPAASAQTYVCGGGPGPGEVQVGTTGGSHGIAEMPVCAASGSSGGDGYAVPRENPMTAKMNAAMTAFNVTTDASAALSDSVDGILKNPNLERYFEGGWEFYRYRTGAPPGEFCAALFTRANSFMQLSGPGGDYRGAMISFITPEIPVTATVTRVQVTLEQTGFRPQTVEAFNYVLPGMTFGAISLAIPTVKDALDGFQDAATIALTVNGKKVANLEWKGGHAARDQLRSCIEAR